MKMSIRPNTRSFRTLGGFLFLVSLLSMVFYLHYTKEWFVGKFGISRSSVFSSLLDARTAGKSSAYLQLDDKDLVKNINQEGMYRARVSRYQDVCAVRKEFISSNNEVIFFKNPNIGRSLSYCKVPKTGCTFWKRIYQFLNKKNVEKFSNPFNITRFQAQHNQMHMVKYNEDYMQKALRFFFVRDPYTRLMSAYIDKFLLPQFLSWNLFGKTIAKYRNKSFVRTKHKCIKEIVTFAEFVEVIVLSGTRDQHWRPMNSVCDPCKLYPHFIGKQETFLDDAKYILSEIGLQHLISNLSHNVYVEDEIRQVVDFTYSYNYMQECLNNSDIASRLWRAFQMNGYLPSSMVFPKGQVETLLEHVTSKSSAKDMVSKLIIEENIRAGMSRAEHSKQKREMMLKEFGTLSKETMEKLAEMYETDFMMFGYEKYPKNLFSWRYVTH